MILGDGPLSNGARQHFGDVPFAWLLFQPPLPELAVLNGIPEGQLVVLSTPAKVGTLKKLSLKYPQFDWAVMPENVRLYHPEDWKSQDRFVIGTTSPGAFCTLSKFFSPTPCIWMSPESAEMVKHGLNGFLAVSVAYAKELGALSEMHGANPADVAYGIMTDSRVGLRAYLKPFGGPGQHLLREVDNLIDLGAGAIVKAAK